MLELDANFPDLDRLVTPCCLHVFYLVLSYYVGITDLSVRIIKPSLLRSDIDNCVNYYLP